MLIEDENESAGAAADRRNGGKRHASVLLVGRVWRGGVESACLVHDISAGGLKARLTVAPTIGEELLVEVRGLPPVRAAVRWVNGRKAGLQFIEPQPVEHVFQLNRHDGVIARAPRFNVEAAAIVRLDAERFNATLVDISAGGAKLAAEHAVDTGQAGQMLLVDTGTALFGKVCWADEGRFGFRFVAPLPLDALTRILGG